MWNGTPRWHGTLRHCLKSGCAGYRTRLPTNKRRQWRNSSATISTRDESRRCATRDDNRRDYEQERGKVSIEWFIGRIVNLHLECCLIAQKGSPRVYLHSV